jgi:hypothetical protein
MNKVILILSFPVLMISAMSGQKAPIKFGDVSLEELEMKSYPADTSTTAVILCDYGSFVATAKVSYGNTRNYQFTRIRRIKILKKEGYSWANSGYPCNINTQIRGITFNLENGKIVKTNLKNESIFKDRVTEDKYVMRIAMPNVKVGSVIDLIFTSASPLQVWRFQEEIPVKYSELIMEDTPYVRFKNNFFGYEPLLISTPNRWVAKNMPSFKVEPLMTSKENYLTKLEFDFLDIGFQSITTSWEDINRLLIKNDYFGNALINSGYLGSLAKKIEESNSTREERLKQAFEAVKSEIKWDENENLYASNKTLAFPFKMKIGNSADINLILLQLLKKLKFDVVPIVLSTRDNGFLSQVSPSLEKLNYVIVLVKCEGKSFLLDATEPFMPYYLLPLRCLNYTGRMVNEASGDQITVGTTFKDKEFATYQLKMQEDNKLSGKILLKNVDYAAHGLRKKYSTFNSTDEYIEDYKKDKQGLQIVESTIYNIDSIYLPVIEDYRVTIDNQVNEIGNEIYVLPMFYHRLKENPFKMDSRTYPVDFGYNIDKTITASIEIPENYIVSELPATVRLKLPDNAASLTYIVNQSGNIINVKSVFSINKIMFLPSEYNSLREFYDQVIKKHSEPIILKRI